jgi:hypothetical protein
VHITARILGIGLLVVAMAGAACGGSDGGGSTQAGGPSAAGSTSAPASSATVSTPPQVTGSGACALITQDEAASALGASVPTGSDTTASIPVTGVGSIEADYCSYGSEVLIARFDLGSAGAALFSQYRQSLSAESDFQVVGGVGDEAFFAKGQLAIRHGDTGLIVDVGQNTGSVSGEQEKEQTLGVAAVGRL